MAINTSTFKYRAYERYSQGWTDPRGLLSSTSKAWEPFTRGIITAENATAARELSLESVKNLWELRFKDTAPTEADLAQDNFYYAIAHRLWKSGQLKAFQDHRSYEVTYWPAS